MKKKKSKQDGGAEVDHLIFTLGLMRIYNKMETWDLNRGKVMINSGTINMRGLLNTINNIILIV